MLLRVIEKIRQKPKSVRQRYAFVFTVAFTAMVTGIWSLSLPARFASVQEEFSDVAVVPATQSATAPFSGVWDQFKKQLINLTDDNNPTPATSTEMSTTSSTTKSIPANESKSIQLKSGSTITFGSNNDTTSTSTTSPNPVGTTSPAIY